ncbi:MAG: hypothetical protein IKS45_09430 [Thermoguttaceae bacterium]|nr:hypothetical protein [Thermoguttaceae bacterium]MBR6436715.1 hypothetical protein [Thermoguttaceae bacterium]
MLKKLSVRIYQIVLFLFVTLYPFLSFAARKKPEPAGPEITPPSWSAYMSAYMLVVLCIGLALMVTCAPVHRRDKPLQKD